MIAWDKIKDEKVDKNSVFEVRIFYIFALIWKRPIIFFLIF